MTYTFGGALEVFYDYAPYKFTLTLTLSTQQEIVTALARQVDAGVSSRWVPVRIARLFVRGESFRKS